MYAFICGYTLSTRNLGWHHMKVQSYRSSLQEDTHRVTTQVERQITCTVSQNSSSASLEMTLRSQGCGPGIIVINWGKYSEGVLMSL